MKNSKIHSGLENSVLRDFLSTSLIINFEMEFKNNKLIVPHNPNVDNAIDYAIKDCENDIAFYNKKLQILKERQAILTLIKIQGWKEFDVSDETEKDLVYTLKMNFIGTQSEYDTFISNVNKY